MDEQPDVQIRLGDCREIIATLPDCSIDSIVTDPPYELGFMGKKWDASGIAYDVTLWEQCLRVLKPGGHLLAFGGTRTYHRMTCAIEDSGFEIRDCIVWLYGSGFPKSHDVSKGIDRKRYDSADVYKVTAWIRLARDAARISNRGIDAAFGFAGMAGHWTSAASQPAVPTLDQIPQLLDVLGVTADDVPHDIRRLLLDLNGKKGQPGENWARREVLGTATKGSSPLPNNHNGHWQDGQKDGTFDITAPATDAAKQWQGWGTALKPAHEPIVVARKPLSGTVAANVQQHGTGALNIDGARVPGAIEGDPNRFAETDGASFVQGGFTTSPVVRSEGRWPANVITDGSIEAEWVRYFYVAKPSKRERNAGLDGLPQMLGGSLEGGNDKRKGDKPQMTLRANHHPTVKPLALMRYLVRLVTPPGGTVLEPFAGSGTTLMAAVMEGCNAIGCELTAEYLPIIEGRVAWAREQHANQQTTLFGDTDG